MDHGLYNIRSTTSSGFFHPVVLESSGEIAVEQLLTDIPFFSAGLLAFGVFTFLFFMKCVTILSVYLYASSLLAFLGSVIDLIPILALSRAKNHGASLNDSFNAFFIARGTMFALSIGLRFLFLWTFVAQPLKGGQFLESADVIRKTDLFKLREQGHSASWGRWGIFGLMLKWTLLTLVLAITVLEILWRDVNQLQKSLYFIASSIEAVVSALFMVKLALNMFISSNPLRQTALYYLAPLFALSISLSLPVVNIVTFLFSETTPGRFLQAIELYILIVYDLTCTFYQLAPPPPTAMQLKRSSSFQGLDNQFLPDVARRNMPGSVLLIGRNPYALSRSSDDHLSYLSMASQRLPSIFRPGSKQSRPQSGEERLWDQSRAEKGRVPPLDQIEVPDLGPRVEELMMDVQNWRLPSTPVDPPTQLAALTTVPPPVSEKGIQNDRVIVAPVGANPIPDTAFSVLSYYGTEPSMVQPLPTSSTIPSQPIDSPIYGLNGIMGSTRTRLSTESRPYINSVTSIDDLLRKQRELDKSIEALRFFSSEMSAPAAPPLANFSNVSPEDSTSVRSDLSLSNFPEPPSISKKSSAETIRPTLRRPQRRRVQREERPGVTALPPPIVIPPIDEEINGKLPQTVGNTSNTGRFQKFDSAGTQYDVTSFIGNLTGPSGPELTSAFKSSRLSDVPSVDERDSFPLAPITRTQRPRPMVITSANTSTSTGPSPYSGPATASSGLLNSQMFTGQLDAQRTATPQKSGSFAMYPSSLPPIPPPIFRDGVLRKPRGPTRPRVTVMGPRPVTGQ